MNPIPPKTIQLTLFDLSRVDRFVDPLPDWDLNDVRALALDPDVEIRRTVALSNWNWDVRLQRVLATDPDEQVVVLLLSRADPGLEAAQAIFDGPHVEARRTLAGRNLPNWMLFDLLEDDDPEVVRRADATLRDRGFATTLSRAAK